MTIKVRSNIAHTPVAHEDEPACFARTDKQENDGDNAAAHPKEEKQPPTNRNKNTETTPGRIGLSFV